MSDEQMKEVEIAPNVTVAVAKVVTSVGVKVIRANGDVEELEGWQSHTQPPAKAQ